MKKATIAPTITGRVPEKVIKTNWIPSRWEDLAMLDRKDYGRLLSLKISIFCISLTCSLFVKVPAILKFNNLSINNFSGCNTIVG